VNHDVHAEATWTKALVSQHNVPSKEKVFFGNEKKIMRFENSNKVPDGCDMDD
jgi:hypothetical protein